MNSELWTLKAEHIKVGLTCLMMANHEGKKWYDRIEKKGIEIKPGEFLTSQDNIAELSKTTRQVVRTALSNLTNINFLTIKVTKQYTKVIIIKWDTYQIFDIEDIHGVTNEQPSGNQAVTTTKECKEEDNIVPMFETFWKHYPRKIGKKDALKRFKDKSNNAELLIQASKNYADLMETQGRDPDKIKHATTFIAPKGRDPWDDFTDQNYPEIRDAETGGNDGWDGEA